MERDRVQRVLPDAEVLDYFDVHEAPPLGLGGDDPLVVGDVVAIESGLWATRVGGVTSRTSSS